MVDRLNLTDFTGGLHLRRSEFTLGDNQSPDMLNVEVDPKVGFFTRQGWTRWNTSDIVSTPTISNWAPRHAYLHPLSTGGYLLYIANGATVYYSGASASFTNMTTDSGSFTCDADPHLADFTSWGDVCYIATGQGNPSYKKNGIGTAAALTAPIGGGSATFNDDYTTPAGGYMPKANLVESHLGYVFVAGIEEDYNGDASDETYPNRLRWSHPNEPEDWATLDFIDVLGGGNRITALKSYQDALLIFKEDSIWALYGYNADSWQLIQVSSSIGTPSPAAITRSPNALYFYSGASRGGVYAMPDVSTPVHISDPLEEALEEITEHDNVWLSWMDRRLWCCLPWAYTNTSGGDSVFVFDPEVGEGAWVCHQPALGALACVVDNSDIVMGFPVGVIDGSSGAAAVLKLNGQDAATDQILANATQSAFDVRYRTGWKFLDTPDVSKSWLRPRFVLGQPLNDVQIDVDTYWDYDASSPQRQQRISLTGIDAPVWDALGSGGSGFDWGDGTLWGANPEGSLMRRTVVGDSLGWASAVSLEFSTNPATAGTAWSTTGIILKYRQRRSTT